MMMPVLLIDVMLILDVFMNPLNATIIILVLLNLAILQKDVSLLLNVAVIAILVLRIVAMNTVVVSILL
jgi:hypothetical protein